MIGRIYKRGSFKFKILNFKFKKGFSQTQLYVLLHLEMSAYCVIQSAVVFSVIQSAAPLCHSERSLRSEESLRRALVNVEKKS